MKLRESMSPPAGYLTPAALMHLGTNFNSQFSVWLLRKCRKVKSPFFITWGDSAGKHKLFVYFPRFS